MAQYLILIYEAEEEYAAATPEVWQEVTEAHGKFGMDNEKVIAGGNALQPTGTATSIRSDGAVSEGAGSPVYLALADSFDEAVAQANAKVDLAEHALAVARASIVDEDPLSLGGRNLTRTDRQQLEFYKNDVAAARRNLMRILHQRNTLTQRPFA